MRIRTGCAFAVLVMACGGPLDSATAPSGAGADTRSGELNLPSQARVPTFVELPSIPVCPGPAAFADVRCHAHVVTDEKGTPAVAAAPAGLGPTALLAAYGLASVAASSGAGKTIAIVDAYDDPNAERDLAVYRTQFGLPSCTTANGCFRKVDQNGRTKYPRANSGWALEISLDLQMASAICPNCNILLVEASSNSMANLGAAVNTAVRLGATAVSNSYGSSEYASETSDEVSYFNHPGVAITASSGDSGYGVEFPAASRYVTAVGGTTLRSASNSRGWTEMAWSGAGSGCSGYVTKPTWQTDSGCARRSVADVAAVADPSTGVAVYDSYGYQGQKGWFVVGGTSASAPIVASVYALAGNANPLDFTYGNASSLNDVTSGSNGSCSGSYLCTAGAGYDGPTGLGTPSGTGAF